MVSEINSRIVYTTIKADQTYALKGKGKLNVFATIGIDGIYNIWKRTFMRMVEKLRPVLEPDESKAVCSSGSPVTTELKLSLTLRFLCGACHDHAAEYPVSEYRVSRSHIDERPPARAYPPRSH